MRDFWVCARPRHGEESCVAGMGGGSRMEQKEVREMGSRSGGLWVMVKISVHLPAIGRCWRAVSRGVT